MLKVKETRLVIENMTGMIEASIYFEDDPRTGISIPKAKMTASELPRGQIKDQERPEFIQAIIKSWKTS